MKACDSGLVCVWRFLITDSVSFHITGVCSDFVSLLDSVLVRCIFVEIYKFLISCLISWHINAHRCLRIICIFVLSKVTSPFVFSYFFFFFRYLPFLHCLAKFLFLSFFFFKPAISFIVLLYCFSGLYIIYFCSDLSFFPFAKFGLSLFFFFSSLRPKVWSFYLTYIFS